MLLALTQRNIDAHAKPPSPGDTTRSGNPVRQLVYFDTDVRGLKLVVGSRAKTFALQTDLRGKTISVNIGRYGEVTPKQARTKARELLVDIANGNDPRPERRARRMPLPEPSGPTWKELTLRDARDIHLSKMRKQDRAKRSIEGIEEELDRYLGDWLDRPLVDIKRTECDRRHSHIGEMNGKAVANRAMRYLRACWNSARRLHEEIPTHPVVGVVFFTIPRRREPITWASLPAYWAQVEALRNPIRRDLRHVLLLTGLRSTDGASIRWEEVNLGDTEQTLTLADGEVVTIPRGCIYRPRPKGGRRSAFTVPLAAEVLRILARRRMDNRVRFGDDSGWAFPSYNMQGRLTHVRQVQHLRDVRGEDGVVRKVKSMPSPHRLRDTFATAAHEAGVHPFDRKALMNHKLPESDVTEGYTRPSDDHLRKAADRVADFLLAKAGVGEQAAQRASA